MGQDELTNWKQLSDGEGAGRILEFDLEYPKELPDLHNDYPLAPELMEVNKIEKLIPNLNNKSNYIIHHESLKLYEELGLRITKIHRGIKFVESNWLEPYIMKNTNLRMQSKNDFEKDFFKLTLMYEFHYTYIEPKYKEKAKLLFTDTDSLMYEIETDDFYKDISPDVRAMFDTSNYPKDHPSGIETGVNKKVIGMFKDEAGGLAISEFVGLRAKLYSFKMLKANEVCEEKKSKGTKKAVVKKQSRLMITSGVYLAA